MNLLLPLSPSTTSRSFLAAGCRHPAGALMLQRAMQSLREGALGTLEELADS